MTDQEKPTEPESGGWVTAVDVVIGLLGFGAIVAVVFALVQLYEASLLGHLNTARKVIGL